MDQGPLVTEQINAGSRLITEFGKWMPLHAAFWLKEREEGQWYFYLVSDQIDDTNFDIAYREVIRILGLGPHLWLDPIQVKVAGVTDPIAKDVIAIQEQYPNPFAFRLRNQLLGNVSIDEALIYPLPVPTTN